MSDKKFNNIKDYLNHWNKFFVEWNNNKERTFKKNIWSSYRGKGNDELEYDVFPQPYLGDVKNHSVITLNLNPSRSKKNKENIEFEEKHLPKFDDAKNYYEYAKYFPTYNIEFWKKQADWIDRIFENLEKEKPSKKQIKPFAIEICPWGSKSFQALKIDDHLVGYIDKHVFDIIGKANENSKLQIVFSVGKAYYDIFKDHKFEKIEEFTKHQNSEPYVLFIESNNNDFEENIKEIWPKTKDKNGNHRYVNRSFSFWRKNNVIYYNSWGPGSNNPPGKNFHRIEKKLFQNYDQLKLLYIDLDGVVADFVSAMHAHPLRHSPPYDKDPDTIPGLFRHLKPIDAAIKSVEKLLKSPKYDVYFLSTAPWNNPSAWTDKRLWIEEQFGDKINRRLILTHRKDLVMGDILIDDRPNNGAENFQGEWIHFGSKAYPNWLAVLNYLL